MKDILGLIAYIAVFLLACIFPASVFDFLFLNNSDIEIKNELMLNCIDFLSYPIFYFLILLHLTLPMIFTKYAIKNNWSKYVDRFFDNLICLSVLLIFLIAVLKVNVITLPHIILCFVFLIDYSAKKYKISPPENKITGFLLGIIYFSRFVLVMANLFLFAFLSIMRSSLWHILIVIIGFFPIPIYNVFLKRIQDTKDNCKKILYTVASLSLVPMFAMCQVILYIIAVSN